MIYALLLLACGYPAEDFAVDMAQATCTLYDQCGYLETFGFADAAECAVTVEVNYDPELIACTEYDKAKSEECVEAVGQMTCDDLYAGAWPTVCSERCGYSASGGGGGQVGDDTGD